MKYIFLLGIMAIITIISIILNSIALFFLNIAIFFGGIVLFDSFDEGTNNEFLQAVFSRLRR